MERIEILLSKVNRIELERAVVDFNENAYDDFSFADERAEISERDGRVLLTVSSPLDLFLIGKRLGRTEERAHLKDLGQDLRNMLLEK